MKTLQNKFDEAIEIMASLNSFTENVIAGKQKLTDEFVHEFECLDNFLLEIKDNSTHENN